MSRFSVIPASYVFLRRGDEVLLQLRQHTGYMDDCWTAGAAGHIELGETAVQAAAREVTEELGVVAEELTARAVMQRTDGTDTPREQRVDWFFTCERWSGEPSIREPEKCAALDWFRLDALPDSVPDYERLALEWIRDHAGVGILATGFPAP